MKSNHNRVQPIVLPKASAASQGISVKRSNIKRTARRRERRLLKVDLRLNLMPEVDATQILLQSSIGGAALVVSA